MSNVLSSIRVQYEPIRSLAHGSITGTYAALGTPFANPSRIIKITNTTDHNVFISDDGVNDKDIVAGGGFTLYDYASDKADMAGVLEQAANTQIYVRSESANPTIGTVYLTLIYAAQK